MELLKQQVEALIFCSEQSISLDEIKGALEVSFDWQLSDEEVLAALEEIKIKYASDDFSFELLEVSEGFQFMTKKQYYPAISALIQNKAKKKLSVAQMETLSIIAYRQPISKAEVEHIRGVSCDYAIQKLLEKEMIEISGKSDGPGRPVLYSTSRIFMDYFGIRSVKDLPQLKDIHVEQNEIGISSEMSDSDDSSDSNTESKQDFNEGESIASPEGELSDVSVSETEAIPSIESSIAVDSEENVLGANMVDETETVELTGNSMVDESLLVDNSLELIDRKSIFLENEENHNVEDDVRLPDQSDNDE